MVGFDVGLAFAKWDPFWEVCAELGLDVPCLLCEKANSNGNKRLKAQSPIQLAFWKNKVLFEKTRIVIDFPDTLKNKI